MNIIGIVTEYNPFHNGHLYQIEQIKKLSSRPAIVAVMSGYFCQRGEPSIISPRSRAKMALLNGVDLVLQIPTYSAVGSAEDFASGSIRMLDSSGICEYLVFGAEQDRLDDLNIIAETLIEQEDDLWLFAKEQLKSGISYAKAREQFISDKIGSDQALLLRGSNQILAIEYLKAIKKYNINLKPWLIPRKGSPYLSTSLNSSEFHPEMIENLASALAIRNKIEKFSNQPGFPANIIQTLIPFMPKTALAILLKDLSLHQGMSLEKLSDLIYYNLEKGETPSTRYLSEPLINRLQSETRYTDDQYLAINQLVNSTMTKQLPATRVKRALINLLLNIKDKPTFEPSFIRVLGFNKLGRYLLRRMTKSAKLPIISNFSQLQSALNSDNSGQEKLELRAARIWLQNLKQPLNEIFESPIIV